MDKNKLAMMCMGIGEILRELYGEEFEVTTADVDQYFDEAAERANITFSDDGEMQAIKEALKDMCVC